LNIPLLVINIGFDIDADISKQLMELFWKYWRTRLWHPS